MKSGLLAGLYALKALIAERGGLPFERLVFIANPDEEIGSPTSTPHIREVAADSDVALVLECARANGDIVSARKGILDLRMTVHGRAAHAGVEPEKGRSAILEAARIVDDLHALNGRWPGVTVNVGVIAGGTPAQRRRRALLARGRPPRDRARGARGRRGRDPADRRGDRGPGHDRRARPRWRAGGRWRSSVRSGRLVEHAQAVAGALGFEVADASTGGASDANTTSGMGVPEPRRPRADRRQRPRAGRVPRGRLDRAADDAAGRAAPRDRRRPRRPGLARRAFGRRPPPAGRERAATDLVGRPVGSRRRLQPGDRRRRRAAGSPARPTPGPTAGRAIPATSARQARAVLGIIEAALAEAGFALADVVRTRMFVTDISAWRGGRGVHGEVFGADPAGGDARRGQGPDRPEPARRDRGRGPARLRRGAGQPGIAARPAARAMATMATAATRPRSRLRRQATIDQADEDRDPLDADVERRDVVVVDHDHHADRGQRGEDRRTDQLEVVEGELRQPLEPGRQQRRRRATGRSPRT